jgi:hypothetical protein
MTEQLGASAEPAFGRAQHRQGLQHKVRTSAPLARLVAALGAVTRCALRHRPAAPNEPTNPAPSRIPPTADVPTGGWQRLRIVNPDYQFSPAEGSAAFDW